MPRREPRLNRAAASCIGDRRRDVSCEWLERANLPHRFAVIVCGDADVQGVDWWKVGGLDLDRRARACAERGQGSGHDAGAGENRRSPCPRQPGAIGQIIYQRGDAVFEARSSSDGDGGCETVIGSRRTHDRNQVRRVVGPTCAKSNDDVVGGALAFAAHASPRHPEEWIQPEDSAGELGGEMRDPVAAGDMRHLMRTDRPYAFVRPVVRGGGKQDARTPYAPGQRNADAIAADQRRRRE